MTFNHDTLQSFTDAGDFMDALEPLITAHAAWAKVHRDSNGYDIYQCSGTLNDWGSDYHIALGQDSNTTFLRSYVFEGYDMGTERIQRPCIRGSAAHVVDTDGSIGDTQWEYGQTYGMDSSTQAAARGQVTISTTATEYWLSVTNNRLVLATRTTSTSSMYLGLFDTFLPNHAQEFPLVLSRLDQTSTSTSSFLVGGWSRHPNRDGFSGDNRHFAIHPFTTAIAAQWTVTEGIVGSTVDPFHNAPVASRNLVRSLSLPATFGHVRGLLYDVINVPATTGVQAGDTIDVNGFVYSYTGNNGNWINTEVAA